MARLFAVLLTAAAVVWALVLLAAPLAVQRGGAGPSVAAAVVYGSASRFCHQHPERSFTVARTQLPVCARCSGLYVSGAIGVLAAWLPRRRRGAPRDRLVLAVCALPTALTWGLEVAGLASFSNLARALAALPLGAGAGWLFVRALRDESFARTSVPGRAPEASAPGRAIS